MNLSITVEGIGGALGGGDQQRLIDEAIAAAVARGRPWAGSGVQGLSPSPSQSQSRTSEGAPVADTTAAPMPDASSGS